MSLPEFQNVNDTLERLGAEIRASECHGLLCGLLCTDSAQLVKKKWRVALLEVDLSPGKTALAEFDSMIDELHQETVRQINHETLNFHLLLPAEADSLAIRTDSLASWCQGFIYGLGLGGINEKTQQQGDAFELIRDFAEISKAGYNEDDPDDEEADAFSEIEEYVRVGVLLINEELQPIKQQAPVVH